MNPFASSIAMAQEAAQGAGQQPSLFDMLLMPAVLLAVMYFFIIMPQQRRSKEHRNLLSNLKNGDEVVTSGGLIGKIRSVADSFVTLEVGGNTSVKVMKANVTGLTKNLGDADKKKS